jgi:hypothetical protein
VGRNAASPRGPALPAGRSVLAGGGVLAPQAYPPPTASMSGPRGVACGAEAGEPAVEALRQERRVTDRREVAGARLDRLQDHAGAVRALWARHAVRSASAKSPPTWRSQDQASLMMRRSSVRRVEVIGLCSRVHCVTPERYFLTVDVSTREEH